MMKDTKPVDRQVPFIPANKARRLKWMLVLATVCFVAGIFLPMITITKFLLVENSFSVVSGVSELLLKGHLFLFLVVAGFSIVLPALKIGVLFRLLSVKHAQDVKRHRYLHLMHEYGRWSMLDVLVVAVMIVTVKLGAIVDVQVHYGMFVFGVSVLLIMLVTSRVVHLSR
jgi:paraquat-inducible protein A